MIECINFKKHESGTLLGFADFYDSVRGQEIFGCTLHQKDARRWLNLPSREYMDGDIKKYVPIMRYREKEDYEKFISEAKEAIDNFLEADEASMPVVTDEIGNAPF